MKAQKWVLGLVILAAIVLTACAKPTVQKGDYILVTYTGRLQNGTIFDTNDPKLQSEFSAPPTHFTTLAVHIGAGEVVPGFENALLGMKEGETKTVTIKAKDAYGTYDAQKVVSVPKRISLPRTTTIQRTVSTPKAEFLTKTQETSVSIGQTLETTNFLYNVTAVNATDVTLYIINATREPIQLEGTSWNSTLVKTTSKEFTYKHDVIAGENYTTQYGPYTATLNATHMIMDTIFQVGQEFQTRNGIARVTKETADSVTLDFNHPLAGSDLDFTITVDTIQQNK